MACHLVFWQYAVAVNQINLNISKFILNIIVFNGDGFIGYTSRRTIPS